MGVSVYWLLCVCVHARARVYVCVMLNQSTSITPHVSDLSGQNLRKLGRQYRGDGVGSGRLCQLRFVYTTF